MKLKNLKVALIGAESTGKTTLAKKFANEVNCSIINENAREILKERNLIVKDLLKDKQLGIEIQYEIIERRLKKERKLKSFISDRSTLDNLMYYLKWFSEFDNEKNVNNYINLCFENAKNYDYIFLCPTKSINLKKDNIRLGNEIERKNTEIFLLGLLYKFEKEYNEKTKIYELKSINLNDRIYEMRKIIY